MDEKRRGAAETAPTSQEHDKDNSFYLKLDRVFDKLLEYPQTNCEVSVNTGIKHEDVCKVVAKLHNWGLIEIVKTGTCPICKKDEAYIMINEVSVKKPVEQSDLFQQPKLLGDVIKDMFNQVDNTPTKAKEVL